MRTRLTTHKANPAIWLMVLSLTVAGIAFLLAQIVPPFMVLTHLGLLVAWLYFVLAVMEFLFFRKHGEIVLAIVSATLILSVVLWSMTLA